MKHRAVGLLLTLMVMGAPGVLAQDALTLDERINQVVEPASNAVGGLLFTPLSFRKPEFSPVAGEVLRVDEQAREVLLRRGDGSEQVLDLQRKGQIRVQPGQVLAEGDPLTLGIEIPFILAWLVAGAVFFTLMFRFVNLRLFRLSLDVVRGRFDDPDEAGEVSHFQALTAALSGTVGLGNIAGVAIAISLGGPGATFWMILAGILGMSTKFVECTLGVRFRKIDASGEVHGGPMWYLSRGISERFGGAWYGKVLGYSLAVLSAILVIGGSFGGGNMFQVNQAASQFSAVTGWLDGSGWVFGLVMALLVGVVILGGIRSIARVTDKIVPFMCGVYVLAALVVIFGSAGKIPWALGEIFRGAFQSEAIYGGFIGVLIQGFRRAAFSNEAGVGSASIAHSAVRTDMPASEGIVALLEPFIDTVLICTMTALVIVITGTYQDFSGDTSTAAGVALTSAAFAQVIKWFPYVLMVAVVLFAFSTMITWSYYGLQASKFLFGDSLLVDYGYKLIFCAMVVVGAAMNLGAVTDFSDAMILGMAFPNILGLYLLYPYVQRELDRYLKHLREKRGWKG
jgi:AGCS family alanine or glycine:cation symporter